MCVDPEIASAINVTDIQQERVTVSWSNGQTQVVNSTIVSYKATDAAWTEVSHSSQTTTHTVPGLEPGTEYQFYVKTTSYGKASKSNIVTITTGKRLLRYDSIRYDTRCYFNMRSKANMSQLNLPHGTDN